MMNAWITAFIASVANFILGFLDEAIFQGFFYSSFSRQFHWYPLHVLQLFVRSVINHRCFQTPSPALFTCPENIFHIFLTLYHLVPKPIILAQEILLTNSLQSTTVFLNRVRKIFIKCLFNTYSYMSKGECLIVFFRCQYTTGIKPYSKLASVMHSRMQYLYRYTLSQAFSKK